MNLVDKKSISYLLEQVNFINTSYEKLAEATGENFNIFQIFNLDTDENKMHSRFIEMLLNPDGTHGQGAIFLKLFLEEIKANKHLDINSVKSKVEHSIGEKKLYDIESEGGRIDIYLWDKKGKSISIENKIYAADQEKQIIRYINYNNQKNLVYYLTLNGSDASEFSKGNYTSTNKDNNDFHLISYEETILNWINNCQKECTDFPILRETIKQYKNLIKHLTYQNINSKMNKEISDLIVNNKVNLKNALIISSALDEIKKKLSKKLDNIYIKCNEDLSRLCTSTIFKRIEFVPKFNHQDYQLIRIDLYLNEHDYILYNIHIDRKNLNLKTTFDGNGEIYEKLVLLIENGSSNLILDTINYDDNIDDTISIIESNILKISKLLVE